MLLIDIKIIKIDALKVSVNFCIIKSFKNIKYGWWKESYLWWLGSISGVRDSDTSLSGFIEWKKGRKTILWQISWHLESNMV